MLFRSGKVIRVESWLSAEKLSWSSLEKSYFYSDSINDLPLTEKVTQPIPTNPDQSLRAKAMENGWSILELFA